MRSCRWPWVTALLGVVLLVSCGGGDGGRAPASPTPSSPPPSASPTPGPTDSTVEVSVFFPNGARGDVCTEVFPVARQVAAVEPLRGALEALLAGPTAAERTQGYEGWFSSDTAAVLDHVRVEGARAYVSLAASLPELIPNASSSCGSSLLLAQLDRTATQFPGIEEAWYALDGDRADFYGWLQLVAPDDPGLLPSPEPSSPPPTPEPTASPPTVEPTSPPPQPPPSTRVVPPGLIGTEWSRLPTSDRVVALTFDAGANGDGVPSILATLADTGVPATFFLTGRWVTAYPTYAQTIGDRYPVGNHTQTHPDVTTLSDDALRAEVEGARAAIGDATGRDTRPWFRFPYGARDQRAIGVMNALGYGSVRWTVDTTGWRGTSSGVTRDQVVQRVLDELRPGAIVLMHVGSHPTDGSTLDADALPAVIGAVRAAGYGFVDLDAWLG